MPISGSAAVKPAIPTTTVATPSAGGTATDTYKFVAGWLLMITLLIFMNKSKVGHVLIYYMLLLMILLVLVTEYSQIAPLLNIQTIGELNQ